MPPGFEKKVDGAEIELNPDTGEVVAIEGGNLPPGFEKKVLGLEFELDPDGNPIAIVGSDLPGFAKQLAAGKDLPKGFLKKLQDINFGEIIDPTDFSPDDTWEESTDSSFEEKPVDAPENEVNKKKNDKSQKGKDPGQHKGSDKGKKSGKGHKK